MKGKIDWVGCGRVWRALGSWMGHGTGITGSRLIYKEPVKMVPR
jgi:hypothetical protein